MGRTIGVVEYVVEGGGKLVYQPQKILWCCTFTKVNFLP